MFGFFRRLFRIFSAASHSALDKMEDPVKMTEQGIRDLKKQLSTSHENLAQAKAVLIQARKEMQERKEQATSYEGKAVALLQKAQSGHLPLEDAENLARQALAKRDELRLQATTYEKSLQSQEGGVQVLEGKIQELKTHIQGWERELTTLKARSKIASTSHSLNRQLAQVDTNGTLSLLERMREKVQTEEALAASYTEIKTHQESLDNEIQKALGSSGKSTSAPDPLVAFRASRPHLLE